jgi:cytochrome b subunit of formate dehydrogenase
MPDQTIPVGESKLPDQVAAASRNAEELHPVRYFIRFTLLQRYMHAIMFTTFLGLAATGLTIRFSTNAWAQHFAFAIGGFGTILFLHKFCAVILSLEFLYHLQNIAVRILVRKEKGLLWGPDSMVPNLKDLKDIIGNFRWFFGRGPKPKLERYAYWEKFDYWSVFWGMIIIGLSGYVMWFGPFFGKFLPGWALNAVQIVHGEEALLAATFIFSIHFINAHLRPDNFPMDTTIFTGTQTEEEFKERHPEEYERLMAQGRLEQQVTTKPPTWLMNFSKVTGFTAVLIGVLLLVLSVSAYFRE